MKVICPGCSRSLRLSPGHLGKQLRCPRCFVEFLAMVPEIEYTLERGWYGTYSALYECPACQESLRSSENQFGQEASCPSCTFGYTVPGFDEISALRQAERDERELRIRAERERRERILASVKSSIRVPKPKPTR